MPQHQLIYLLLKDNKLADAEALINKHQPEVSKLVDAPLPKSVKEIGSPFRNIALLSIVYSAQGKNEKAGKLADRLTLLDEAFFSKGQVKLMSHQYIYLAEINAIQNHAEKAIDYLEAAIENGYLTDWRIEISQSPFFLSLNQYPRFIALIERLETEMVRQRAILEKGLAAE